jgi:peptide/nickel transport system substrate-binding protein
MFFVVANSNQKKKREETMFTNKKLAVLVVLVMIAPIVLAACGATPEPEVIVETVVVEQTKIVTEAGEEVIVVETVQVEVEKPVEVIVEVEVTAVPEPVERTGGWFDTVIFLEEPDSDAAVTRLEVGDIDVFAYNISEPDIAQRVFDSEILVYETSYGNFNDLTFMPSTGPEFNDGRLNPFYSDKIREAMNWLVDRDYIAQEITGGLARPRFVPVNYASKDSALLADTIAAISLKYAHNPDRAVEVITAEMEALGATMADGKWTYNGEPVVLTGLIRVEDERLEIGDYVSNLLEDIGFTVERDYKTSAEASPCWLRGDPDEGCAHFYTGGWVSTAISRDAGGNFSFFYTPDGLPFPPWQAYTPVPEFYEIATKLNNNDFATMEERAELMATALNYALEDSQRIWLKDDVGVAPHAADISLASDLSGSIYGSSLWSQTMRRAGEVGGSVNIAMPSIMTEPWNAIAGTNWVYDMMPIRGILDRAVVPDPFTGLQQPNRLAKAEVFVEEGLPVDIALDWVTLEFVPEIVVPDDAWADWDAENQVFITAAERFTQTETAASKVVMYYEDDLLDKMSWHDGSPFTIGDMVIYMILQFDRSKEASPYYDESSVPAFQTFMDAFKGWKVVSADPVVIEYYTDAFGLDAENNITNFRAAWPEYDQGQAAWHNLVPGLRADAAAEAAFSADKAEVNEVEWLSYIAGPSLEILKAQLDAAQEEGFLPFEPTLGQYISDEEAAARYANLQEWYRRYGHFHIGTGPYFLQRAFPVEGTLILQHYDAYPDPATKWDRFATAPVPEVLVDGPGSVTIGEEATYDIFVTLQGEPYAVADIDMVKYLVFDATGELAYVGDATAVEDGYWQAVLGADVTGALEAGSNQFAAIVVSKRALVPITETMQFVTQ